MTKNADCIGLFCVLKIFFGDSILAGLDAASSVYDGKTKGVVIKTGRVVIKNRGVAGKVSGVVTKTDGVVEIYVKIAIKTGCFSCLSASPDKQAFKINPIFIFMYDNACHIS